jgi:hypothetical protein
MNEVAARVFIYARKADVLRVLHDLFNCDARYCNIGRASYKVLRITDTAD